MAYCVLRGIMNQQKVFMLHDMGSNLAISAERGCPVADNANPQECVLAMSLLCMHTLCQGSALKGMALGPTRSNLLAASPLVSPFDACTREMLCITRYRLWECQHGRRGIAAVNEQNY